MSTNIKKDAMKGWIWSDNYAGSFGVPGFIERWQSDAVAAIATISIMGDRDSYPGDYVYRLVKDGVIARTQLHEAMKQWILLQYSYIDEENRLWGMQCYRTLLDIYGYTLYPSGGELRNWLVVHYDECAFVNHKCAEAVLSDNKKMYARIMQELPGKLLQCVCRADQMKNSGLRLYLRSLCVKCFQGDILQCYARFGTSVVEMFLVAYYDPEEGEWDDEAHKLLNRYGQKVRRHLRLKTPQAQELKGEFTHLVRSFLARSSHYKAVFSEANCRKTQVWLLNQCIHS